MAYASLWTAVQLVLFFLFTGVVADTANPGAARPSAKEYLETQCRAQEATHTSLLTQMFLPWAEGLDLQRVLSVGGDPKPIFYFTGGNLAWHPSLTSEHNASEMIYPFNIWLPTAQAAVDAAVLPDSALLFNVGDGPIMHDWLPWMGFCHIRMNTWSVTWPTSVHDAHYNGNSNASRAGAGDNRLAKAVFRGSPTGWARGRRRALMVAGQRHPDLVDAGIASMGGGCGQCHEVDPVELQMFLRPSLSLQEQVDTYRYIISADGNCAANRVKDELSSDSAVFLLQSPIEEWFTPLLVPFKHYIPVMFEPTIFPADAGLDLAEKIQWANDHPQEVADIVRNANEFARLHTSFHGQVCFTVRMLTMYHDLLQGVHNFSAMMDAETQAWKDWKGESQGQTGVVHKARAHLGRLIGG